MARRPAQVCQQLVQRHIFVLQELLSSNCSTEKS